jgi:peptide/nickel transport system substrate-binding protein
MLKRRTFLTGSTAVLIAPAVSRAESERVLRFTLDEGLAGLDPQRTVAGSTRIHAFAVFDTLFGMNSHHEVSPQMAEGVLVEDYGRRWTITLREGLRFHDGEPVLARDCVASIRRSVKRNVFGQALFSATDDLSAVDDRRIVFRLKKPFPLLPDALGTPTQGIPVIMPEWLANSGDAPIKEMIGSGPFRFKADERVPGSLTVYERFADYRPRETGTPDWLAGPKIAYFDRIEWKVVPDASTRAAALQNNELDWWGTITPDLGPLLSRDSHIRLAMVDSLGHMLTMMMNHLQPPFSNREIRQAVLHAVNQEDFVQAVAGAEPEIRRTGVGLFPPRSSMASDAGLDVFRREPDMERVRRDITAAGYNGERVVLMSPADDYVAKPCAEVGADMLRKAGMNVDFQSMDVATLLARMQNEGPVDKGGWSCWFPDWLGISLRDPAANPVVRGNGAAGGPAWVPTSPRLEELREAWFDAGDLATRQRIAAEIQVQALSDVTTIPLGLLYDRTAYRTELVGILQGWPVFWNVRRQV